MVYALGSDPSSFAGLGVRLPPTVRSLGAVGSAAPLHGEGHGFEPCSEYMNSKAIDIARRHRLLKIFWLANFPVCIALYMVAPSKITLLYLALVSVYANYAGEAAVEQAAVGRDENPATDS